VSPKPSTPSQQFSRKNSEGGLKEFFLLLSFTANNPKEIYLETAGMEARPKRRRKTEQGGTFEAILVHT